MRYHLRMLAHDILGPDTGPLAFILHGILGSRRNWASFARRLSQAHPAWRFATIDLRNHGDSNGFMPPHDLGACARDVAELAGQLGQPSAIIGHSFGGKVALLFARDHGPVDVAWALDSPPGAGDPDDAHEIQHVIAAVRSLQPPFASRTAVIEHFVARGLSEGIGRWMTTNVARVDPTDAAAGLGWRFDIDAIEAMLAGYWAADLWPFVEAPGECAVHLMRGGASDRWSPQSVARLDALPADRVHLLPGAGHWVHVADPSGVLAALAPTLVD